MRLYARRRFIAGTALLAFLFAVAFPALAVVRQAVDPLAYAKICRVDIGIAADEYTTGAPGSLQGKLKTAHCVMCVGTASPPPLMHVIVPVVVAAVPELVIPVDYRLFTVRDPAVLQPLNPRAPPRV
jgi:hypothetical protein